jgi:hypothetical protein
MDLNWDWNLGTSKVGPENYLLYDPRQHKGLEQFYD